MLNGVETLLVSLANIFTFLLKLSGIMNYLNLSINYEFSPPIHVDLLSPAVSRYSPVRYVEVCSVRSVISSSMTRCTAAPAVFTTQATPEAMRLTILRGHRLIECPWCTQGMHHISKVLKT